MKNAKKLLSAILCTAMVFTSAIWPDTTVQAAGRTNKSVKSITLNVKSKQTMYVGSTKTIKVKKVIPNNASKKVKFKSSAPKVVKVSSRGVMKAVKAGKATVTVTSAYNKKVTKRIKITVKNHVKKKVEVVFDKSQIALKVDVSGKVNAKVKINGKAVKQSITYLSADKKIASVDSNGQVVGVSKGTTTIIAKTSTGQKAQCKVTVTEPDPDKMFEVPYVSTYYFNPKPSYTEENVIPIYITDYNQSEYIENDKSKRMDLAYEVDGKQYYLRDLKLGDNEVNLGRLSVGMHTFSLQSIDKETGWKSHKLYNELWVIDPKEYEITDSETYTVTQADLDKYKISNRDSTDSEDLITTRDGLTQMFQDIRDAGYRKCILLKGTYRINGEGARQTCITVPSEFTVDMNGSTFKLNTITCEPEGGAALVRIKDGAFDSHLINGTLEGDRFERKELGLEKGYLGEGINTLFMGSGKYCSVNNLVIKNTTGHTVGSGTVTYHYMPIKEYKDCYIKDGQEIASDIYKTGDMVDISDWKATDYIRVGNPWGYKGVKTDTPIVYVNFYDADKNFITTVAAMQYRRLKIVDGACYASVTVKSQEECNVDTLLQIYQRDFGDYQEISDVDFYDTRTTAIAMGGCNLLIDRVTYTRCGCSITPCPVDFEDPRQETQDIYYRNVDSFEPTGTATVIDNAGFNHVYENVKNHYIVMRRSVYGGTIRNINDINTSIRWGKMGRKYSSYGRVYNNNCGSINVITDEGCTDSVMYKVKNCTFAGNGFASSLDQVEYESCTITKLNGSTGIFKNCTITPGDYFRDKMYFYNCTFVGAENESDEIKIHHLADKEYGYYNCNFKTKTWLDQNMTSGTFENCEFADVRISLGAFETVPGVNFKNCKINSAFDSFIYVGPFAYSEGYTKIKFENCDITHTGTNLVYLYSKVKNNSIFEFNNCKINKTSGNISSGWLNLANSEEDISVDIKFKGCDVDKGLTKTTQGDESKVRVTFED